MRESNEANRVTFMILLNCLIYLFGNALDSLGTLIEIFGFDLYNDMYMYIVIGNVLLFGSHGLFIFNYYYFNRNFRNMLKKIFMSTEVYARSYESSIDLTNSSSQTNQPRKSSAFIIQSV